MPVRPATEDDRERWLELRAALWPEQQLGQHDAAIGSCLRAPMRRTAFLHEPAEGTAPTGLLEVSRSLDNAGIARIEALYVVTHARRHGVARSLLEAADVWASRAGCRDMQLDWSPLQEANDAALNALGFREASRVVTFRRRVHAAMAIQADAAPVAATRVDAIPPRPRSHAPRNRTRSLAWLHLLPISLGIVCLLMTDIFSDDPVRGGLLPVLDLVFIIYVVSLLVGRQYRRRTNVNDRTARLFDTGPPPPPPRKNPD